MRAKKGRRKIVVDDDTYYWNVKEDDDYFYEKKLIVIDENGSSVLTRCYSLADAAMEDCWHKGRISAITPAVVRGEILEEKAINLKRAILDEIKYKESPQNWKRMREIDRPEIIAGIGLDVEDEILLCIRQIAINLYSRTIIDLPTQNVLLDDQVSVVQKNKEGNKYLPFGPLKQEISCLEWNSATRTAENQRGDKICCYSFYPQFIYFQPAGEDCLQPEINKECVRLNKTNVYNKYAFSASGDYFVAAEKKHLIIWKRE